MWITVLCLQSVPKEQPIKPKHQVLKNIVHDFFLRDDNSHLTPGVKDTITRKKVKEQKRFMNFCIELLFEKFRAEFPNVEIGRATFFTFQPFFVLKPRLNDRSQCLCMKCLNLDVSIIVYYYF